MNGQEKKVAVDGAEFFQEVKCLKKLVNAMLFMLHFSEQAAKSMGGGHELAGSDLDFFATG